MSTKQKHGHQQLEDQLELIGKVDLKVKAAEILGARTNGKASPIQKRVAADVMATIREETERRHEIEAELHLLRDPIQAEILRLHYTQGYTVSEIGALLAGPDSSDPAAVEELIQRILEQGVAAFDRLHR